MELEAGAHGCNGLFGDVGIGVREKKLHFCNEINHCLK